MLQAKYVTRATERIKSHRAAIDNRGVSLVGVYEIRSDSHCVTPGFNPTFGIASMPFRAERDVSQRGSILGFGPDNLHVASRKRLPDIRLIVVQAKQAIAWMKKCGIAVESASAGVPGLAHVVAGAPIQGSWWAHPKGKEIFLLSRVIRRSPDVLVCRLVDGKITYVHRRMWPALVSLAGRFAKQRLSALKEVHTPASKHKLRVTPLPDWVPIEVLRTAQKLTEKEAASQLALVLSPSS